MDSETKKVLGYYQQILTKRDEVIEAASLERDKQLSKQIAQVIKQQTLSGQIATLQQQKEIITHMYDKAAAYSNLIILAGYAGAFGIWQLMKTTLSSNQNLLVACLLIISISLFSGFEVCKMISQARFFRRLGGIIKTNFPSYEEQIEAWSIGFKEHEIEQVRVWLFFLIPTVVTGFGAGFFLLWFLLKTI